MSQQRNVNSHAMPDGSRTRNARDLHFDRAKGSAYYDQRHEKLLTKHRKKNPEEEGDDYLSVLMSLNP
jgi:hypothetical protein